MILAKAIMADLMKIKYNLNKVPTRLNHDQAESFLMACRMLYLYSDVATRNILVKHIPNVINKKEQYFKED